MQNPHYLRGLKSCIEKGFWISKFYDLYSIMWF